MCLKYLFTLVLLFCLSCLSPQMSFCLSEAEEIANDSIILQIQLMNCEKQIQDLESELENLKKNEIILSESEKQFIEDLKNRLAERGIQYEKLLKQAKEYEKTLNCLEIQNKVLIGGIIVVGAVAISAITYAILK